MQITFGNLTGHYFSQGAIDNVLVPLANRIKEALPIADHFEIWYDPKADFSHCKFNANGHVFDIRFYKVYGLTVDGKLGWNCPVRQEDEFVRYLSDIAHNKITLKSQ